MEQLPPSSPSGYMSSQELSFAERKSLLNFSRHLDRLRSRLAHKKEQTSQDEAALFVLEKCLSQVHQFQQDGKVPPANLSASLPRSTGDSQHPRELSSLLQFIKQEGLPFERRYGALSPAGLDDLREHMEDLEVRLQNEFGSDSVPARIVATAVSELQGRAQQILRRIKNRK